MSSDGIRRTQLRERFQKRPTAWLLMRTDRCGPDMGLADRVQEDRASRWRLQRLQPASAGELLNDFKQIEMWKSADQNEHPKSGLGG